MRIGLIVGHEKKAPGAVMAAPYRISEYQYNSEIAKLAQEYGKMRGVDVEIFYRDGVGILGAYKKMRAAKCDCCIELHFNAANGKAFGTETLCSDEGVDKQFAYFVQQAIEKVFDRVDGGAGDRGVKVRGARDRGGTSLVSYPGGANCLVEPFFGDNPTEAKMALERKGCYAKALIDACVEWYQARRPGVKLA